MKSIVSVIVGIFIIIFMLICPFPPIFGVPGLVWRCIIAGIGCVLIVFGLHGKRKSGKMRK